MNATQHSCSCDKLINNQNKNNSNNNSNSNSNSNHLRAHHSTPLYRRYEFPILAEDPQSFAEARTDPLACNVNNDAVLVWHDVISRCDHALSAASLAKASIEDVFLELQHVAKAHELAQDDPKVDFLNSNSKLDVVVKRGDINNNNSDDDKDYHHGGGFENPVVSRRRLYEQGHDALYGRKLDSRFRSKYSRKYHSELVDPSGRCPESLCTDAAISGEDFDRNKSRDISHRELSRSQVAGEFTGKGEKDEEVLKGRNGAIENYKLGEGVKSCYLYDDVDSNQDRQYSQNSSHKISSSQSGSLSFLESTGDSTSSIAKFDSGHFEDISVDNQSPLNQPGGIDRNFAFNVHECAYSVGNLNEYKQDLDSHTVRIKSENSKNHLFVKGDAYFVSEEYPDVFVDISNEDSCIETSFVEYQIPPPLPSPSAPRTRRSHRKLRNHKTQSRRVSAWRDETAILVQCENPPCGKIANLAEARKSYKNCHHCVKTYYCSRECRKQDWKRHKQHSACPGSRVSSACKKVIRHCNTDPEVKSVLSRLATRGYLAHGRGCVMLGFPDLKCAEEFVEYGFPMLELNPVYVSARELSESKMYGDVLENLLETCRSYRPDVKFVLNVGVRLNVLNRDFYLPASSALQIHHQYHHCCHRRHRHRNHLHDSRERSRSQESDLGYGSLSNSINLSKDCILSSSLKGSCRSCCCSGFVCTRNQSLSSSKYKGPILQRFIKLKLNPVFSKQDHDKRWTFEDHFWDQYRTSGPTLILTSIPECSSGQTESRKRELTFINIQRKLRQRNVNLRRQYPAVYSQLIDYVTKGAHFPSQILLPVDTKTGRTFACFMMPEAEAELEWMQSNHLLNDLELSRSSLDKSLSRSVSTSMPSLVGHPGLDTNSSTGGFNTEPENKTHHRAYDSMTRSGSFTHLDLNIEQCQKPKATSSDSPSKQNSNAENSFHQRQSLPPLESNKTSNHYEIQKDLPPSKKEQGFEAETRVLEAEYPPVLAPVALLKSNECTVKEEINRTPNGHSGIEDDTTDPVTPAGQVTPRYYPVRKAKNIKLFSSPTESTQRCPSSSQRVRSFGRNLSPVHPVESSPNSQTVVSPLSPGIYASTPKAKSANFPPFETFISASPSSPPIPQSNLSHYYSQHSSPQNAQVLQKASPWAKVSNQIQGSSDIDIPNGESSYNYQNRDFKDIFAGYGFNSSYRNEVIVDEADRMKRRRKGRSSELKSTGLFVSGDYYERFWCEAAGLNSPPLATSTLSRDVHAVGGHSDFHSSKRSQRKKFRRDHEEKEKIVATGTSSCRFEVENSSIQFMGKNELGCKIGDCHNARKANDKSIHCKTFNSSVKFNSCNGKESMSHQEKDVKNRNFNDFDSKHSLALSDGALSENGIVSETNCQQSSTSTSCRRNFNSNSPYFPNSRAARLNLPLPFVSGSGSNHETVGSKGTRPLAKSSPQRESSIHNLGHLVPTASYNSRVHSDPAPQSHKTSSSSFVSPSSTPSSQRIQNNTAAGLSSTVDALYYNVRDSKPLSLSQSAHHQVSPRTHSHHGLRIPDLCDVTLSTNQSGASVPPTDGINRRKVTFDFGPLTIDTAVGRGSNNITENFTDSQSVLLGYSSTNADSINAYCCNSQDHKSPTSPRSSCLTANNKDLLTSSYSTSLFPQHHRPSTVKICYSSDW